MRLIALLACGLLAAAPAAADAPFRCDGRIVDPGMSVGQVLMLCGPPDFHWAGKTQARARNPAGFTYWSGPSTTERMIYDRGYGRFPVELEFFDGELRRIELLTRGTR